MKLLSLLLALSTPARAARLLRYEAPVFESLQSKNQLVLLQFSGPGCEICRDQEEALERIAADPVELMPVLMRADLNPDGAPYKVSTASTLLLFRKGVEIGRVQDVGTEEDIREFIRVSLERIRGRPGRRPKRAFEPKR